MEHAQLIFLDLEAPHARSTTELRARVMGAPVVPILPSLLVGAQYVLIWESRSPCLAAFPHAATPGGCSRGTVHAESCRRGPVCHWRMGLVCLAYQENAFLIVER